MRAVVYDRSGPPDVLRLADVERPVPAAGEVLVKVHATTVNRFDTATREANRRSGLAISLMSRPGSGIRRPRHRILGTEFAGEVEAAGAAASEIAVGDKAFGTRGLRFGAHAEDNTMPVSARLAPKPGGILLPTDGLANLIWALLTCRSAGKKVVFQIPPRQTKQDVLFVKSLVEAGRYRPVIDRRYRLEDVIEATRYVETEQKTGNVVVRVSLT